MTDKRVTTLEIGGAIDYTYSIVAFAGIVKCGILVCWTILFAGGIAMQMGQKKLGML